VNGYHRLQHAADRKGWEVKTTTTNGQKRRLYVNESEQMIVEVIFTGYLVHSALLFDGSDDYEGFLTTRDRDKASRIEDVLLCNGRRF
jgi:hypothetical protein